MHEFECSGLTWATPPTHQQPNTQPTPIYRCWLHAKFIEFIKWIYEERSRFALALSGVGRKFKRCQKQTRVYTLRPCKFCVSIRNVFPSISTLQTLNVCQWWRSQTVPAASLIDSRFMRPCCGQSNIDWVRKGHSFFDLFYACTHSKHMNIILLSWITHLRSGCERESLLTELWECLLMQDSAPWILSFEYFVENGQILWWFLF